MLLDNPFWPEYARRWIASIADERGQEAFDTVFDLLLGAVDDIHRVMVIIHAYTETQQREAFAHPQCVPGSDATTLAPDGALAETTFHGAYTGAAWFWRYMVTEHKLLSPADAVRRLTGAPAERLGLSDRGVLRAGAHADIVVFEPTAAGTRDDLRAERACYRRQPRPRQRCRNAPERHLDGPARRGRVASMIPDW